MMPHELYSLITILYIYIYTHTRKYIYVYFQKERAGLPDGTQRAATMLMDNTHVRCTPFFTESLLLVRYTFCKQTFLRGSSLSWLLMSETTVFS
jgi:hypothetical protein